jgi:hypothetical protein
VVPTIVGQRTDGRAAGWCNEGVRGIRSRVQGEVSMYIGVGTVILIVLLLVFVF